MNPWLFVFSIYLLMLVVVLVIARRAERQAAGDASSEVEETYEGDHKPNRAWRELDTYNARYGAGRPLQ